MRILNKTDWRTDHLRAFVSRIAAVELNADQRKCLVVHVSYTRPGARWLRAKTGSSGYAYYGGRHAYIRIHKDEPDKIDLAFVIAHELAHVRGMRHRLMRGSVLYDRVPGMREHYAWAEAMPLEKRPEKPKAVVAPDAKLNHARAMLAVNESKLKRYTTLVKKWRKRVQYYERRGLSIAAVGSAKGLA
jgi:hypothetical protein